MPDLVCCYYPARSITIWQWRICGSQLTICEFYWNVSKFYHMLKRSYTLIAHLPLPKTSLICNTFYMAWHCHIAPPKVSKHAAHRRVKQIWCTPAPQCRHYVHSSNQHDTPTCATLLGTHTNKTIVENIQSQIVSSVSTTWILISIIGVPSFHLVN